MLRLYSKSFWCYSVVFESVEWSQMVRSEYGMQTKQKTQSFINKIDNLFCLYKMNTLWQYLFSHRSFFSFIILQLFIINKKKWKYWHKYVLRIHACIIFWDIQGHSVSQFCLNKLANTPQMYVCHKDKSTMSKVITLNRWPTGNIYCIHS